MLKIEKDTTSINERKYVASEAVNPTTPASVLDYRVPQGNISLIQAAKYSIPKAAQLAGIGQTNLRASIKSGELRVLRVTKTKVLILEPDLEAFLKCRHGYVQKQEIKTFRKSQLPDFVVESKYLKGKAN